MVIILGPLYGLKSEGLAWRVMLARVIKKGVSGRVLKMMLVCI